MMLMRSSPRDKIADICDKVSLSCICLTAFFLPISKGIIESLSILAIVSYVIRKIAQKSWPLKSFLNPPIVIYILICVFSIFTSSNIRISFRTFIGKTMQYVAFFWVVAETMSSKSRVKAFLYILFTSSLVLGIDGLYQYFTRHDFIRNRPIIFTDRIYASFPTPNSFGCYLAAVIPFLLSFFFMKMRFRLSKIIYMSLFLLLFTCLLLTISRGAWLAFLSSALFMSLWVNPLGIFLLILSIFIIATGPFYNPFLKERLSNFFNVFSGVSDVDRRYIWQAGWRMFASRPLIGVGIGTFMFNFKNFVNQDYRYSAAYAHNCYLQTASEIGIIGLISFLSILVLFFYYGIKALNTQVRDFYWHVLLACLATMLGYCVQMGVDTTLYGLDLGLLFWLMLGLGVASIKNITAQKIRI